MKRANDLTAKETVTALRICFTPGGQCSACPLCGQPIQTDSYEDLEVLSCFAWIKENAWLAGIGDPAETEDERHE